MAVLVGCLGLPVTADAQPSASAQAGFQAIILTPAGALPQTVLVGPWSGARKRFTADVRYGRYRATGSNSQFHNLGFGAQMRFTPRLSVGATLGSRTCDACEGLRMAGADVIANLFHKVAETGDADTDLSLHLSAGFGRPNEARFTARSFAARLPFAVTIPQSSEAALTLFLSPGAAYGSISDDAGTVLGFAGNDGDTRFLIAAGIAYEFAAGLGVHGTVQRIIIDDSPTQIGLALAWSFGGVRAPN